MTKTINFETSLSNDFRDSLNLIRHASSQLQVPTDSAASASVLVSRIELCDVLLLEISGIRSGLAKDLKRTRKFVPVLN